MLEQKKKVMKTWENAVKPIIFIVAFAIYVFLANIYKAKWRGEEPWAKDNIFLVGAVFNIGFLVVTIFELVKRKIRNKIDKK